LIACGDDEKDVDSASPEAEVVEEEAVESAE
jgi:hypothetical protein